MSEGPPPVPGTIIINAKGDVENVFAPKANPPVKNDLPLSQVTNLAETLTAAAAGAAMGEIIDAAQANSTKDKVAGDRVSEAKEPMPFGSINSFGELTRRLGNKDLPKDERSYLEAVRDRAIHDVEDLDEGRYLVRVVDAIERELPNLSWGNEETNRNVFERLTNMASNLDSQLMMSGGRREWNGIMGQAMEAEIARLRVNGYVQRENQVGDDKDWKFKNRYSDESIERLKETSERLHVFNLLPENAEALVGINIKKEEPPVEKTNFDTRGLEDKLDKLTKLQEEQRDLQKQQERHQRLQQASQEEQVELMKRGYDGLIQILDTNAPMDPRTYKLNLPLWYNRESKEFRQCVDFMANANYIAAVKRTCKGPSDVFDLPLSLNTRDIEYMWANLPGFKEAMTTMVSDIFDPNIKDRFVISGHPADVEKGISATGGYRILESDTTILEYKDRLSAKIGKLLDRNRVNLSDRFRGVSNKDHATAAVATMFNTLYGGGAFDSGDEQNKLNPGQPMAVTLSFRMLYMPGARGESKWLAKRKTEKGVFEEDFGGPIGRFLRWNASHTPGYADKIRNGDVKYLPKRMLFSMFEHETFTAVEDGGKNRFAGKSLAEALITVSQEASSQGGIKIPTRGVGFDDIERGGDMFTSYVANAASYVLPVYDHLTSNDPKKRLAGEQAINLVMKCRKDERLRKIFYDSEAEDMITVIAGLAASPEGFETGTDKLLLKIPEQDYVAVLKNVLSDDRWFEGMPSGFKERMAKDLNAPELLSEARETLFAFFPSLNRTSINPRQIIRAEIRKNFSKI